jgi:hypothetical protein
MDHDCYHVFSIPRNAHDGELTIAFELPESAEPEAKDHAEDVSPDGGTP